ncbi:MAG: MFS transporter [Chloroflexota bacterium]|nr:MFS transporter [Chloroflexota bacterium]
MKFRLPYLKPQNIPVIAWVTYDTGNTVFFTGVMGLLFPLWITKMMGGDDATLGFTLAIAMAIVFIISPVLGTISDQTGKRKSFLVVFTILFIASGLLIGTSGLEISLGFFVLGVVAIHTADIFYNALLEDVSNSNNMGLIAGLGVGLGYLGAIVAVLISFMWMDTLGHLNVIRILSILMLTLTLPLMLVAKNKPGQHPTEKSSIPALAHLSLHRIITAIKTLRTEAIWTRFLVARFWYMWAINAAGAFLVLYGIETLRLTDQQVHIVMLLGIITGIPSGVIWGKLVDTIGPLAILKTGVAGLFVLLCVTALIPLLNLPSWIWGIIGILSGIAVAGVYVAERPFVLSIARPGRVGEYFSLNSMSGRLSAVAGPFSWGIISVTLGLGQIAAVLWLTGCLFLAFIVLSGIKFKQPGP